MTTEGSNTRPQAVRRPNARTLVPLAGLLGVVIVTTALIGLFGLHYAHKGYKADMHRVEAMMIRLDEARGAQVHFKKQVQEWKNLLLRGGDPAEYRRYFDAFVAEEAEVVRHLGNLDGDGAAAGRLRADHGSLGSRYREALAAVGSDLPAADRRLRGIDRQLDDDLGKFADTIRDEVFLVRRDLEMRSDERYDSLRQVATWGLALCVLLVGVFLRLAIRRERTA